MSSTEGRDPVLSAPTPRTVGSATRYSRRPFRSTPPSRPVHTAPRGCEFTQGQLTGSRRRDHQRVSRGVRWIGAAARPVSGAARLAADLSSRPSVARGELVATASEAQYAVVRTRVKETLRSRRRFIECRIYQAYAIARRDPAGLRGDDRRLPFPECPAGGPLGPGGERVGIGRCGWGSAAAHSRRVRRDRPGRTRRRGGHHPRNVLRRLPASGAGEDPGAATCRRSLCSCRPPVDVGRQRPSGMSTIELAPVPTALVPRPRAPTIPIPIPTTSSPRLRGLRDTSSASTSRAPTPC